MSETRQYFCGGFARLETSLTKDNQGRRFWTCCHKRSRMREKLLWFFIVIGVLIAMLSANANEHKGSSGTKTVLELA
ncbi:hypothetical protein Pyn_06934 [Prunus yedoensis var. nudiflora]|uniref:Uncharacterized protein n=1 Tax=Prunus yedoensis var. nudiflora TaxID=2094558 RepID=A0A314URR4_PRUYE|nr:hypothetical protein Pyn_06934 [Prunus yedoensis var. nudiflora]